MAYLYRHIRLDKNVPFYIGIGLTRYRHISKQGRNKIWKNIVNKTSYEVEILFDNITWDHACKKEIEFISMYGRIDKHNGTLANMTDGGDGNLGLVHSAEAIKKISQSSKNRIGYWKGKKLNSDAVRKISESKKGNTYTKGKNISEEHKLSVSKHAKGNKYCLGRILSQDTKDKIGAANKGRIVKEPWKCALIGEKNGMWGKHHTVESKRKNSESQNRKIVLQKSIDGNIINEFQSISEAAKLLGIFTSGISASCRKYKGVNRYKKFIWEYKKTAEAV